MFLTCLIALGVNSVMGRGLERRHLTQSGDRDNDRPRVFADHGYLSGDSTPLLVAKDRPRRSSDLRWHAAGGFR